MSSISKKAVRHSQRFSVAPLIVLAIMFSADAGAQAKSGNSVGAPSGVGGATGAASRGGAGGVSNPSPGGSPAVAGEPRSSSGPQTTATSRPGYLGGRSTDLGTVVVNPTVTLPPGTTITGITTAQFGKCPTPGTSALSAQARISGDNLGRVETVSKYVTRGAKQDGNTTATYLLVDLQEELQKAKPDLTLAGTYLGLVATTAITPSLATDIGESLCAPMSGNAAELVARIAEAQRRKLAQGR